MEHIMNKKAASRLESAGRAAPARLAAAAVCGAMGLQAETLRVPRGPRKVAFARQLAMYLTHVGFGLNLTEVGACFERDRTTVRHACALVEDRRDQPAFDLAVSALETSLAHFTFGLQRSVAPEAGR
jgi:chromosomal replication initiation ATPase DnaA